MEEIANAAAVFTEGSNSSRHEMRAERAPELMTWVARWGVWLEMERRMEAADFL